MKLTLRIWRQSGPRAAGHLVDYTMDAIEPELSFLEMLDVLNRRLVDGGDEPVAFDSDCREGICGTCGLMINGVPHGSVPGAATCQVHMRRFKDGDAIIVEPFRARAFPVVKDLVIQRRAFDRIIRAGGFISVRTGSAPEANSTRIAKPTVELAMDAAECIGCGACVAGCPNRSAALFVGAKISHLALLPQGQPERCERAEAMVLAAEREGFGSCSNHRECEAVCPKQISISTIARLNRELGRDLFKYANGRGGKR
jgi:succinate dehydrogenase / fumarate reductase, iron-sulfur subunit